MKYFERLFVLLLSAVLFFPAAAPAAKLDLGDKGKLDLWGLAQAQADIFGHDDYEDRDGNKMPNERSDEDGLQFNMERVRFGMKYSIDKWAMGFQFDPKDTDGTRDGASSDFLRDAYAKYKFNDAFQLKVGQFKMPSGMSNTMSGTRLPLVERAVLDRFMVDRSVGAMISGRYIGGNKEVGGFGYDFSMSNAAGRSGAYRSGGDLNTKGDDYSYVGRLMYDYGKKLHFQVSYGIVEDAGTWGYATLDENGDIVRTDDNEVRITQETEDYGVFSAGAIFKEGPVRIRAEYADGTDVRGLKNNDEDAWFIEGGYRFNDIVEGVVRYQRAECEGCGVAASVEVSDDEFADTAVADEGFEQELSRFEVGMNFFLGQDERNGRVQVYYAAVGDDEEAYNGIAKGSANRNGNSGLFATDQIAVQLQMRF